VKPKLFNRFTTIHRVAIIWLIHVRCLSTDINSANKLTNRLLLVHGESQTYLEYFIAGLIKQPVQFLGNDSLHWKRRQFFPELFRTVADGSSLLLNPMARQPWGCFASQVM